MTDRNRVRGSWRERLADDRTGTTVAATMASLTLPSTLALWWMTPGVPWEARVALSALLAALGVVWLWVDRLPVERADVLLVPLVTVTFGVLAVVAGCAVALRWAT